jgi:hypothetical protein
MDDLEQYALDLQQTVLSRSELGGAEAFQEDAFVQIMLDQLAEAGELDDAAVCLHRSIGLQVSGYAISEDGESLDLIVAIHTNEVPPKTVPKADMMDAFRRVAKFFEQCMRGYFKSIEEATVAFDLAQLIHAEWRKFSRIRFLLVTDGLCKSDPPQPKALEGLRATYDVWDAERFYRDWSSGREREEIEIDFVKFLGTSLPCLGLDSEAGGYSTFLAIFPGPLLVELYARYGPRLLERNVRSFLQVKGSVNKGIRDTIRLEPDMFLAYNNGLSCTASSVTLDKDEIGATRLKAVRDLQIVNGGQTTASIYHSAMKDKSDVSGIGVQVKLTILEDPTRMDDVVPLVSKYANSQNKVQTADLMANDKFHRRIEELSRTIWAPARDGTLRQTRWFYERARGQYRDDIARERTPARVKDFEITNPKSQMFTKTDLAKAILTWEMRPNVVSKGAQFAFSVFTVGIETHIKAEGQVDQDYFERLIAKMILFRGVERMVKEYRSQIVTYSIAKLVLLANARIDMERIWKEQQIYGDLEIAISKITKACYDHIVEGAAGGNVSTYCKKEECWTSFRDRYVSLPEETIQSFSKEPRRRYEAGDPGVGHLAPPPSALDPMIREAIQVGSMSWMRAASYGTEHRLFSPKQLEVLTSLSLTVGEGRHPARKTAEVALALLRQAKKHGFAGGD